MERIEAHLRAMRYRTMGAIGLFAIFVCIALVMGVRGATMERDQMLIWVVPLVCSLVLLPREVYPTGWPSGESEDEVARIDMIRTELTQLHKRVMMIRVVFLCMVLVTIGLLPMIGS